MEDFLDDLLQSNNVLNQDKFYRKFSRLNALEDKTRIDATIAKVWELIQKNVLSKNILYLSLLVNKNIDLLKKCIVWDKSVLASNLEAVVTDPYLLFDYTVHIKRHWLYLLLETSGLNAKQILPKAVCDKLLYLQIVDITNDCGKQFNKLVLQDLIKESHNNGVDKFWIYYVNEIEHLLNILDFCRAKNLDFDEYEFLKYASQNSVLEVGSKYLDLSRDHADLQRLLEQFVTNALPHEEDLTFQLKSLVSYSIIAELLKLIIPHKNRPKNLNVNDIIVEIQTKLFNIEDHTLQIELLQLIFASIFIKQRDLESNQPSSDNNYVCNEKEIQIIIFTLKSFIEEIRYKRIYEGDSSNLAKLDELHKVVTDAAWRLELIVNIVSASKCKENLLYYMLAKPESLINLCLKKGDFIRASQVFKIFGMETTSFARDIAFTEKLEGLKETFKRTLRIREIQQNSPDVTAPNIKLQFDDIVEEFFQTHPLNEQNESDQIIEENFNFYPHLEHYKSDNELFMNILDLAITQTETFDDSRALLHLASNHNTLSEQESTFSTFTRKLHVLFTEIAEKRTLTLSGILQDPDIFLDYDKCKKEEEFYVKLQELYTEFSKSLTVDEEGVLNKDHPSHKLMEDLQKHCSNYFGDSDEMIKYLQKLFNYLRAFSKVLYIEKDCSELISNGKNKSYFELLAHNRSELMGKLLFQQNLDPTEFEKYFSKLKLDFLYHVAGNCFPTINLHTEENVTKDELYQENILYPPNQAVITYIMRTNRLLALILLEMYKVEGMEVQVGESRLQHFINYLRISKIDNLQALFKYNEIITALQNEISYQKLHDFIHSEIGKNEFLSSTHTSHSSHSLETAEEIGEDELKATNWRKLFNIIDSVPEKQLLKKENNDFVSLRDMVLVHLVKDAFECEYYKFTLEIWDRNTRIDLLLDNMKAWPEDFCISCIKSEITRFDQEDDEKIEELRVWLSHIEHSKKVMAVLGVTTWAKMYDMCAFQPKEVLHKLLISKKVDLLLEFIELHEISNTMLLCVDEDFIESAFDMGVDISFIKKLIKLLPQDHTIKVCRNLLSVLKNVKHLQFITNYLMKHSNSNNSLRNIALSLKMLSVFSHSEFDQQLLFLLRDPMSIIEVLVMNTKLDKLAAVLDIIRTTIPITELNGELVTVEKIDELLRRYAEKSLDFRVIAQPNPRLLTTPDHKLLQSLDSINLDPEAKVFIMPEEVPTKEQWVGNSEVVDCMCCSNVFFSMFNRRHHCRRCGRVVCSSCSKKRMIVPAYGDILVRVCYPCYDQTFKDLAVSDDTISTKSVLDDYWMLTSDPEHNRIVREEFSYEFAPSVSLCLSLMKFHSTCDEYSKFLVEQCDMLLKLLLPNQEPLQEIDYMLVIRMLKSLALAAKMVSQDTSLQYGSSSADRILSQAELLGLLAERGCLNLLPMSSNSSFIDAISLMRLTDKLLEKEQWNLALEVSTKAGIDKSGVFVAWGKSCLKAGSLAMAREKFSKCLDKNPHHDPGYYDIDSSSLKVIKNPPLLNEIIKILESKQEPIDEEVVKDYRKTLGSTLTLNQSVTSSSQPDDAIFVLNKLWNLKNIEGGYYSVKKRKAKQNEKSKLENIVYEECVYYLNKYGTAVSLVEFHIKHGRFERALENVIKKQLPANEFVAIYMKCLKEGSVKVLQTHLSEMDSTLSIWKDHLMLVCSHLEKQHFLNSLYQLQQYMGDYVRAAMTCVRFYEEEASSFTDLLKNINFLNQSQEHLSQAREQEQWVAFSAVKTESERRFEETNVASPLIKKMSNEEIEKHSVTIKMQIEITQFLADCEAKGVSPMRIFTEMVRNIENAPRHRVTVPTLFGTSSQRKYLAVLCLICGETIEQGFELVLRIINEFKLKPISVYKETGKYLAQMEKINQITDLVGCIQNSSGAEDALVMEICDEMLLIAVVTLKNANGSDANVEELIKLISDKNVKIDAYIEANKLSAAYYLASKYQNLPYLKKIKRCAELTNQVPIKLLCDKLIKKYSHPSSSSADN